MIEGSMSRSMGKSILVATCGYTAAQLLCYPLSIYRNMR